MISSVLKQKFLELIQTQTGIRVRSQDWATLSEEIMRRVSALGLVSPDVYYQRLISESRSAVVPWTAQQREWESFLDLITIGESYFFRDRDQFEVLRSHLLPDLIARQRQAYAAGVIPHRALNLWSAGCSTGEEPYSLAILLEELIPDWPQWQISILGTDLNPAALAKARRGTYRDWSFRQTESQLRANAFHPVPEGWQVHDAVRQRVTFRQGNLLTDPFPDGALNNVHLILCRNVFIYFDAATIAQILAKFHATLSPEGYLVTGHAELYEQDLQQFQVFSLPGSVVYKRRASNIEPAPSPRVPRLPAKPQTDAPLSLRQEETAPATDATTQYRLAQAHWQQGEPEQAMHYCQMALQLDGEAVAPLYLSAQITEQLGDRKQAKTLLKKILYLYPTFVPAYLSLGLIYQQEAQVIRATKTLHTAGELLALHPNNVWSSNQGKITAAELRQQLNQLLKQAQSQPLKDTRKAHSHCEIE